MPVKQMHGREQAYQAEIMIAVQVADQNGFDPARTDVVSGELHLSPLATVDKHISAVEHEQLRCRMTVVRRYGGIIPKDFDAEYQPVAGYSLSLPSSPSPFSPPSISLRKTASTASSTVGRILSTLFNWDILMSFITWSLSAVRIKMPPSSV